MNLQETLVNEIMATGAIAVGFSKAGIVDDEVMHQYDEWISGDNHAGMDYLKRHASLKRDPHSVLEDVSTIISIAYSYYPSEWRDDSLPVISAYAYGEDYHDVLRGRLTPIVDNMKTEYGGSWRICIDSAPIAERYWAVKSGIGYRAMNGSIIAEGHGSFIFLAEILTSHTLTVPSSQIIADSGASSVSLSGISCLQCGECLKACPTGALNGDGTLDSRRCINYLTIEHHGEWTAKGREAMQTEVGHHSLYGCDICQRVCPHNRHIVPTKIKEFYPRNNFMESSQHHFNSRESILQMTKEQFLTLFKKSPIKRTKLEGLLRNAENLAQQ